MTYKQIVSSLSYFLFLFLLVVAQNFFPSRLLGYFIYIDRYIDICNLSQSFSINIVQFKWKVESYLSS